MTNHQAEYMVADLAVKLLDFLEAVLFWWLTNPFLDVEDTSYLKLNITKLNFVKSIQFFFT